MPWPADWGSGRGEMWVKRLNEMRENWVKQGQTSMKLWASHIQESRGSVVVFLIIYLTISLWGGKRADLIKWRLLAV